MRSKRSCFDKTVFKKNLTRFAPVWILYTLLLVGMVAMLYTENAGETRAYFFAENFANGLPEALAGVNLLYALLVAGLLFGDLFNSRMCNALHALPLRREGWMVTNLVSGLFFSFAPTLVMALVALPLLMGTIVVGAWKLAFQMLLLANLEFLCFFGMAVFAAMCVGNWFTMAAGYGLLNAGACIAYWIIDIVYTPMLYGVLTPTRLMKLLTPMEHMIKPLYELSGFSKLYDIMNTTKVPLESLTATYTLKGEAWWGILGCAAVGVVFMALALLLYRKRNLERAGDAVAFPALVPVFQVLCSLFVMVGLLYFLRQYFRFETENISPYVILAVGLILGWIIGKMLVERSTRVFRLKNFYGLGILAAVLALTLVCTNFDILGIETRLPDPSKVESIFFETSQIGGMKIGGEETINDIIHIQELALRNSPSKNKNWRYGGNGLYVKGYDGSFVEVIDTNDDLYDRTIENPEFTYVAQIGITYNMKDGSEMKRRYNIWTESEEGELTKKHISSWEFISNYNELIVEEYPEFKPVVEEVLESFTYMSVECYYSSGGDREKIKNAEDARSFVEAVKADCAAGTMANDRYFHKAMFMDPEPRDYGDEEPYYEKASSVNVYIRGEDSSWYVHVYPDSENCVRWLQERGLLRYEILPNTSDWMAVR